MGEICDPPHFALLVLYPLIWMVGSSFKPEADIFTDLGIIPKQFTLENYEIGWKSNGRVTFSTYFLNSIIVSGLCVIGNLFSCTLAAFAFARLNFKGKNLFFCPDDDDYDASSACHYCPSICIFL